MVSVSMRTRIIAALLVAMLILVPAGLVWAAGEDDAAGSGQEQGAAQEEEQEGEQEEEQEEDVTGPAPDQETTLPDGEDAQDYVPPEEEGEMGVTSAQSDDSAGDAEAVRALAGDDAAQGSRTWIYVCAGAAVLLIAGVFLYSRRKAAAR